MTKLPQRFYWCLGAAAGLVVAALIAFLWSLAEDQRPPLTPADVQGTWTSWSAPDGGRLTVRPDGTADLQRVAKPAPDCGMPSEPVPSTYSGPATWVFDTYPDEWPGIRFDYQSPLSGKTCTIYLPITISEQNGTLGFFPHDFRSHYKRDTAHPG
ncbi:hypothetical protein ACFY04_36440 [Streptomyces sp. NPDC001549]|uniref:hypothetical protein n=1 Tax=Streptomyces sp. NPDC001549 TaxID=3364586 RepID=UPI00369B5827